MSIPNKLRVVADRWPSGVIFSKQEEEYNNAPFWLLVIGSTSYYLRYDEGTDEDVLYLEGDVGERWRIIQKQTTPFVLWYSVFYGSTVKEEVLGEYDSFDEGAAIVTAVLGGLSLPLLEAMHEDS